MAKRHHETITILNDLISSARDSEEGFGKAAKGAHSDEIRASLVDYGRRHADFADELVKEVERLGGEPIQTGHIGAILHRGWVDLEARIRPKDDPSLVAECQRGEESTLKHYQRALNEDLPPEQREIVARQAEQIEYIIDQLRRMEQVRRAGGIE